jgi:CubicO group peptidase (beta-lactamase class C family)
MKKRALVCLFIGSFLMLTPGHATEDVAARLVGLWGSEVVFGPEVRGVLTLAKQGSDWRASIAGFEAPARSDGDALTFVLPGSRGEFSGHLRKNETTILGHWIQPRTAHVWGVSYATPVELKAAGNNVWRGQVVPQDDGESMYFMIRRQEDGTLGAFLRNPERNLGRYIGFRHVECQGDLVRFTSDQKDTDPLVGRYDPRGGTLSVFFPTESATFDFTRRGRDEATGFYPRTAAEGRYVYRRPLLEDDGWETASLTDVGLDPKPISELVQSILATETKDFAAPYIQGLLIARHGKLVLEEYFYGFHRDRLHDTRSAGKTLASALVGIAMDRGAPFGTTTPIYSLFPRYTSFAHDEARKRKITVEHLLTMSSGLDGDDDNSASPGSEERMASQPGQPIYQPDWYKYTLDLPMAHDPGEKAVYCTAGIHLLGGIVQSTTGTWLPDFLYEQFARPLDIRRYHVNLAPLNNAYMGGGIQMRPRDFMKLGQLFLAGGRWRGRQVVSKQWVDRATRPYSSIHQKDDYGYAWWIRGYRAGGKTYRTFEAQGNGGQCVTVIPDLDLVVMFTGGNYNQGPIWWRWCDELVPQFILPRSMGKWTRV